MALKLNDFLEHCLDNFVKNKVLEDNLASVWKPINEIISIEIKNEKNYILNLEVYQTIKNYLFQEKLLHYKNGWKIKSFDNKKIINELKNKYSHWYKNFRSSRSWLSLRAL